MTNSWSPRKWRASRPGSFRKSIIAGQKDPVRKPIRKRKMSEQQILTANQELCAMEPSHENRNKIAEKYGVTWANLYSKFRKHNLKFPTIGSVAEANAAYAELCFFDNPNLENAKEVAARFGLTWLQLRQRFYYFRLEVPRIPLADFRPDKPNWRINWDEVTDLGVSPDADIAQRLNVTRQAVSNIRNSRGIAKTKNHAKKTAKITEEETKIREAFDTLCSLSATVENRNKVAASLDLKWINLYVRFHKLGLIPPPLPRFGSEKSESNERILRHAISDGTAVKEIAKILSVTVGRVYQLMRLYKISPSRKYKQKADRASS